MTAKTHKICCGLLTVVALCVSANSAVAIEVRLRERVTPKASVVRLGDIADVVGSDRAQARKLAAVPLMPAPAPETERFLRKREVADMLAASGVELADVHFVGAEQVVVGSVASVRTAAYEEPKSSAAEAPANQRTAILAGNKVVPVAATEPAQMSDAQADKLTKQISQIIDEYVKSKSGKNALGQIDCNLNDKYLARLATATTTPVCSGGGDPWTGRQKFTLSFSSTKGPVQLGIIADVADAAVPTVVAIRPVARGDVIKAVDVEVRSMEPTTKTGSQHTTFDSFEKLIGMEARQPLQVGDVVYSDSVQSPILVKRGEVISVATQSGGISVRTTARAVQDGSKDDLIQVESIESKKKYDARVVGLRQAAVYAQTRVIAPEKEELAKTARRPANGSK